MTLLERLKGYEQRTKEQGYREDSLMSIGVYRRDLLQLVALIEAAQEVGQSEGYRNLTTP